MAKHYDNLDDVKSKLAGTIIYHDNVPVLVKGALTDDDDMEVFKLHITASLTSRAAKFVPLVDPKLNWTKFNIGYANAEFGAIWWYRQPLRQYRQGLKSEQMKYLASERTQDYGYNFSPGSAIQEMLLNSYPKIDTIEKILKDGERPTVAFHKDFALSWDKIHKDMIIEHRGRLVGCMSAALNDVKLSDDFEYLTESLKEIISVR